MGILDKFRSNEIISPEKRRDKNNKFIQSMGIACLENLPTVEPSSAVQLKNIDTICKRAIACMLSIQLAYDIEEKNGYNESKEFFYKLLLNYNVENELLEKEKRLFENAYSEQDVIDVVWTYETYWSLVWALGLIKDIKKPNGICDCQKAITLVSDCSSYEAFRKKCKLRPVEEILDMLDLYYRYHWACVEKRLRPETNIGDLNPEVVMERRKGLEWLIDDIYEWDEISLDP